MHNSASPRKVGPVLVGGIEIDGSDLLTLARLLRDAGFDGTAFHLERSFDAVARDLLLAIHEREQILQVLDDPPTTALVQLRAVLVREHVGRGGDGLV